MRLITYTLYETAKERKGAEQAQDHKVSRADPQTDRSVSSARLPLPTRRHRVYHQTMAIYKKLSPADKRARIVAPKVAEARRVTVAKSTLGRVSTRATAASTARHGTASTSGK